VRGAGSEVTQEIPKGDDGMAKAKENNHNQDEELLGLLRGAVGVVRSLPRDRQRSEEVVRARRVLAYAEVIIRDSDPILVPASARELVKTQLTNISDNIDMALREPHDAEELLDALSRYPASRGRDAQQAVTEIAERFQRSTSRRLGTIRSEATRAQTEIREEHAQTAEELEKLKTALETRADEIDQRVGDLHTSMDSARTAVDGLLRDQGQRFSDREQEYERALEEFRAKYERDLSTVRGRQEAAGEEHVGELEAQAERARKFLDVVTNTGTSGAFQHRANKDEWQAQVYRGVAMILGVAAVALAVVLFLVDDRDNPLAKLGVATTAFGVAGLVWSHATRKQNTAEGRREFELKLASFLAVLETLPQEQVPEEVRWFFREQFKREPAPDQQDGLLTRIRELTGQDPNPA